MIISQGKAKPRYNEVSLCVLEEGEGEVTLIMVLNLLMLTSH